MAIAEASGALAGLKAAFDLTKAVADINAAVKANGRVFELQRLILEAQGCGVRTC